jgi:hypothetical protein
MASFQHFRLMRLAGAADPFQSMANFGGGGGSGGGGSTQSTATSYNTNIPEYAQPYVTSMLNATQQQLFNINDQGQVTGFAPYVPYSANPEDYVAGFTPMQNQAFQSAANLQTPGQFGAGSDLAASAGEGALGTTGAAMGYGGAGMAAGQQGAAIGQGGLRYGNLGAQYGQLGSSYGAQGSAFGTQGADYGVTQGNLYGGLGANYGAAGSQAGLAGQNIGTTQGLVYGQQGSDYGRQAAASGRYGQDIGTTKGDVYGTQGVQSGLTGQELALSKGLGYGETGLGYGAQGASIGQQALGYGSGAAGIGQQAVDAARQGFGAQAAYQQAATDPGSIQAYMNPYVQASLDPQLKLMNQQLAMTQAQNQAQAVKQGAYGGSRQAVQQSLDQQNADLAKAQLIGQGYNQAFQQAQQAQQYGAGLGIQGLGAGTAALQAGIAGQQAGMQGVQGALAGTAQGMQGAGMGLQGVSTGLQGTAQGMQGAQVGLQGAQTAMQGAGMGIQGAQAGMQGSGLGLQGAQTAMQGTAQGIQGAQAGMQGAGVGLQGTATGLQGIGQGIQGAQTGLAGAQAGISGAQTGIQGINAALSGNAQSLQGAQIGLQGVQGAQAGYGLANQAAGQLGQLGSQQLAAQQGIVGLQSQLGAQQQQNQQQIINQAIQDYANAQQYPLTQLGTMSNMLRGLPLQSSTTQQYVAQPNMTSQAIGTLGSGVSMYKAMGSKKGGIIEADKYAGGGVVDSVESKLYDMDRDSLQKELKSPSPTIQKMARRIMLEKKVEGKAGGGIVAFANPTEENNQSLVKEPESFVGSQFAEQEPAGIVAAAPQAAPPAEATRPTPIDTSPAGVKKFLAAKAGESEQRSGMSIQDLMKEREGVLGKDISTQEYRKRIMEERANSTEEARRQNWLRAAEFFASWGSLPGNTLAAGMQALKSTIPNVISDQKEIKKYNREIDKTLYELDKADRADAEGNFAYAAKIRQDEGERAFKYAGKLSDITEAQIRADGARAGAGGADADSKKFERAEKLVQNALKGNQEYQSIAAGVKTGAEPTVDQLNRIAQIESAYRNFYYGQAGLPTGGEVNIPESPAATKAKREKLEKEIDTNTPMFGIMDSEAKKKKREAAQRELDAMGGSSDNKDRKPLSSFQS